MTALTYGARTLDEALRRYHTDALTRARAGWVPVSEDRQTDPPLVVVEYAHLPSAAAEVVSVLEALAQPEPVSRRLLRSGRRIWQSEPPTAR